MEGISDEDFGLTETHLLDPVDTEATAPNVNHTLVILDGHTLEGDAVSGSVGIRQWADSIAVIGKLMSDAAHWSAGSQFFRKRDYILHQALCLAYPVQLLLMYRHDEAKAILEANHSVFERRKGLFKRNPALAALELVLKPTDEEQRKTCSEWAYKLLWASDECIMPEQFLQCIKSISLSYAKESVRQRRRKEKKFENIVVHVSEPSVRIVVNGCHGSKEFTKTIDIDHYEKIMLSDEHSNCQNVDELMELLKSSYSLPT